MSLLNSFIFLASVLFIIAFLGHLTYRSMGKTDLEGPPAASPVWLMVALAVWIIAMGSTIMDRTLMLLIIGGPIAFVFGFTYQVARQTIKKHFS